MNGQVVEFQDQLKFQYGVAPSIGKHQMETYEYVFGKKAELFGMNSFLRVKYLNSRFSYFEVTEISDTQIYERLHLVDFSFKVVKFLHNQWDVTFSSNPQLSSNFSDGLGFEDINLGFRVGVSKRWDNSRLDLGLERSTTLGEPKFLPYVQYGHRINRLLYAQVGFPHTYFELTINERHKVTSNTLAHGYYYNITGTGPFTGVGNDSNTKLSFSCFNFSLEHQYKIQPNITTVTRIGLLANNDFNVEDSNGNPLFTFKTNESIYFSMGLQFNLNKNNNDQ